MSILQQALTTYFSIGSKTKKTHSGWLSRNAPCCTYYGHNPDNKQRGGLISDPDGSVSFSCFNCGFKASWKPGRPLTNNMKDLLAWIGVPQNDINRIMIEVMRENRDCETSEYFYAFPTFTPVVLPENSFLISEISNTRLLSSPYLRRALEYLQSRQLFLNEYPYYWNPDIKHRNRIIVPFFYKNEIVGWAGRATCNDITRYLSEKQPGYVFNIDKQTHNREYVIVVEGIFDAIQTEGVALLTNSVNRQQELLINNLNKKVIILPDRDVAGRELVDTAMQLKWGVSFPDWEPGIKDAAQAVTVYGKLYTIYSIIKNAEFNHIKIKLKSNKWFASVDHE